MSDDRSLRALSGTTGTPAFESRADKLRRLQQAVQSGSYKVDPDQLALAILVKLAHRPAGSVDERLAS